MVIRIALGGLLAFGICASTVWSQESGKVSDDVQKGHHLAALICSNCPGAVFGHDQGLWFGQVEHLPGNDLARQRGRPLPSRIVATARRAARIPVQTFRKA
jgi:hypothetical protein